MSAINPMINPSILNPQTESALLCESFFCHHYQNNAKVIKDATGWELNNHDLQVISLKEEKAMIWMLKNAGSNPIDILNCESYSTTNDFQNIAMLITRPNVLVMANCNKFFLRDDAPFMSVFEAVTRRNSPSLLHSLQKLQKSNSNLRIQIYNTHHTEPEKLQYPITTSILSMVQNGEQQFDNNKYTFYLIVKTHSHTLYGHNGTIEVDWELGNSFNFGWNSENYTNPLETINQEITKIKLDAIDHIISNYTGISDEDQFNLHIFVTGKMRDYHQHLKHNKTARAPKPAPRPRISPQC